MRAGLGVQCDFMANQTMRQIGANVARLRAEKGWRREELATHTGLSFKTVEMIERGYGGRGVQLETLRKLAVAFKVPLALLLADAPTEEGVA